MTRQFEILEQQTLYDGFFRLEQFTVRHTLFNGGWSQPVQRELFRRGEGAAVLLYDPDRDEVVLIEQFRIGAVYRPERAWQLEIVAGAVETGETAAEVARREALEEAGCEILELMEIQSFFSTPGGFAERITLFCGRVDSSRVGGVHGLHEEGEDILATAMKAEHALQMLEAGQIDSAIPIIALQWFGIHRARLRALWTQSG